MDNGAHKPLLGTSGGPGLCRYFSATGDCYFGDECQFLHASPSGVGSRGATTPILSTAVGAGDNLDSYYVALSPTSQVPQESKLATYIANRHRSLTAPPVSGVPPNLSRNLAALSLDAGSAKKLSPLPEMGASAVRQPSANSFAYLNQYGNANSVGVHQTQMPYGATSTVASTGLSSHNSAVKHNTVQNNVSSHLTPQSSPPPTDVGPANDQPRSAYHENVGGTTYFYIPEEPRSDAEMSMPQNPVVLPSYTAYSGHTNHTACLKSHQGTGSNSAWFASDEVRLEILQSGLLKLARADPQQCPDLPEEVDSYHNLVPLEATGSSKSSTFGYTTTVYKATNSKTGAHCCLRRVHGFRLAHSKSMLLVDLWKRLTHSNLVQLREVFTTNAFGDHSIVFVTDYHPGAETMLSRHFSTGVPPPNGLITPYSAENAPRPFSQQKAGLTNNHGGYVAENLLWTYIVQLSAAIRTIHAGGLACRTLDPSKVLVSGSGIGKSRIWLNSCGIFDLLTYDPAASNPVAVVSHYQQEDLVALGKLVLGLACGSLIALQRDQWQASLDLVARNYSSDLRNLILYLLSSRSVPRTISINDIMPMIGARFYTQLDSAQMRVDSLESELAKEIENGRLFRLLTKLTAINERPELNMDAHWSDTGDRYMLKLFRDYVFHPVTEDGRPWLDLAHVVSCLNRLDAGAPEKLCLVSRDEQNVLVITYAELKHCLEQSWNEIAESADGDIKNS